jgi:hypothetical protein
MQRVNQGGYTAQEIFKDKNNNSACGSGSGTMEIHAGHPWR